MKKMLAKVGALMSAFALLVVAGAQKAFAAADTDLVNGFASSTAIFTDNKSAIISYVVGIMVVVIVVGLVIRGLFFGRRTLLGVFGGGRRRR